jgi:CBS domain-containing protein
MSVTIESLMAAAVIVSSPEETVGEIRERMATHNIGAVPVVNADGVLVGILTSTDLVGEFEPTLPVARVMTAPVHTVRPGADAREAAALMRKTRHHHLVVESEDHIVGIVSSFDLLRLVEDQAE